MARNTDINLQKQVIYSVYVRAHTEEGTFLSIIPDLDRIKALGTDIIWFMPIHPIGVEGKKGSLGCPYANRDYRSVNPAYGTMEDFKTLAEEIHRRGMKCMIDVVYNHTSPDAVLLREHPEFYYRPRRKRQYRQQDRRLGRRHRSGLLRAGTLGLSDRVAVPMGEDRGRIPLRRGILRPGQLLEHGAQLRGEGAAWLHLAG